MLLIISLILTTIFSINEDHELIFITSEDNVRWYLNERRIENETTKNLTLNFNQLPFDDGYVTIRVEKGGFKPMIWLISNNLNSTQVFHADLKPVSIIVSESGNNWLFWIAGLLFSLLTILTIIVFVKLKNREGISPVIPVPHIDKVIGDYKIIDKIAEGGLGSVFLVEDSENQKYALKLMTKYLDNNELVGRFYLEANIIKELNTFKKSAPIVKCITTGKHKVNERWQPYLVLEYLTGISLKKWISPNNDYDSNIVIIEQLLDALELVHAKSIIHLDFTPENILFKDTTSLNIVLIDFGVATYKVNWSNQTELRNYGIGKPEYMSPEQFDLKQNVDYRSDYYALGIIIYEMFTGNLPFYHDDINIISDLHQNNPLPKLPDSVPRNIINIVEKLTSKNKQDRPDNLVEIRNKLKL